MNYIIQTNTIKKFSKTFSFSPSDYRELICINSNRKKLKDLLNTNYKVGREIGSDNYMKTSKYRFLKTTNIGSNLLLDEGNIEYCKPVNIIHPDKNDILIVKDGGTDGLGEVCLYEYENKYKKDSISAGIIAIDVIEDKRYYVLGVLKSNHFKSYIDLNTPQGSTIRHSRLIALDYEVPFPTAKNNDKPDDIEKFVSLIVQNILDKERNIKEKNILINNLIKEELLINQKEDNYIYSYPKISDIKDKSRLDTGLYERQYKELNNLIKNYKWGYFQVPENKFTSGSTPRTRIFNPKNNKYKWITPTNITDEGFYIPSITINMNSKNNVSKDCVLIINRTSRGKKGEYVGISCFYDVGCYGEGQHNQGLYQIKDYTKLDKLFLVTLLNSSIYRKICGSIAIGSKMKEMKMKDFSLLRFPKFPEFKKIEIVNLYYNKVNKNKELSLTNYLEKEKKRNKEVGIFQLNMEVFELRVILENIIKGIILDEYIEIDFNY